MFRSRQINKAWPFNPVPNPYYEGWPFPAVTGEGITVMGPDLFDPDNGQIFRTRPQKYEWAPDTYVSFMIRSGCDMGVSRDAVNWKICSELGLGHYIRHGKTIDGAAFTGGEVANGIIRRGDQLFQYVNCIMAQSGATTVRFTQRLDGFLSLDAGDKPGTFITRPFIFDGDKLVLNVAAGGSVKVGIMALHGKPYTGYNVALTNPPRDRTRNYGIIDCDAISTDSVRHVVTWKGDSDVGDLAGQVVRLRFEMRNAKLYAFQFVDED
jgi:hypothetical protein